MITPAKVRPGDRVAVLSPSGGLAEVLPLPFELGLRRLREEFRLVPVEYPTTRRLDATPAERAADIHAAFADPSIGAVIASIGGDDQIRVIPHLDGELLRAHAKPFFGYSDNTNLLLFLCGLGIVSYHGGMVMVEYGRPGAMHPLTRESIQAALFGSAAYELTAAKAAGDVNRPWEDPRSFESEPELEPADGWNWHNADRVVAGPAWGGCLEVLAWILIADRVVPPSPGGVLFLETSEEMPPAEEVYRVLRSMGERGLLQRFSALLMARAKAWFFDQPLSLPERASFRAEQRAAVLRALSEYAPEILAVFDLDIGHNDPQLVIPVGGQVRVDGLTRRIIVEY